VTESFGLSDIGPARQINEDRLIRLPELSLFGVADGMGGRAAGEVAATLAVEAIENFIRRSHESADVSWPYGIDTTLSYNSNRLKTAVSLANRRVYRVAESHDDYLGMGTTIVCALVSEAQLVFAHVGDSRLYRFSNGRLTQMTQDDSWAATLLASGCTDPDVLTTHPNRHVLTNVLGAQQQTDIHVSEQQLSGGELFLLCSDGLHNAVGDDELKGVLERRDSLEALVRDLIEVALERGSRDNISALLVRYCPDGAGRAKTGTPEAGFDDVA
jgi:PPM family protein phosphatase